jgi:hypothetical protein
MLVKMAPAGSAAPAWIPGIYRRAPVSPLWVGIGLALAYLAVFVLYLATTGQIHHLELRGGLPWDNTLLWDNVVSALLVGYLPTATAWSLRGTLRDLERLRAAWGGSDARFREILAEALAVDPKRRRRLSLLVIPALMAPILAISYGTGSLLGRPSPETYLWSAGRVTLLGWLFYLAASFELAMIRSFRRIAARHVEIDLLDPRPLEPFSRHGLRTAFLWIVGFSIFSLFGLTESSGYGDASALVMILAFSAAALVLPALAIRRRIREQKTRELERVRTAVRRERRAQVDAEDPSALAARVANLLVYERRIDEADEWPFAAFTLTRFVLVAALGLGSWLGAALVERVLDEFLTR